MKKIGLVCTTIGNGEFLDGYCQELDRHGISEHVKIIVIPDQKTECSFFDEADRLYKKGFRIECPTLSWQEEFIEKLGMKNLVLKNSDHRRNIGYLMALERGAEVVISIDDDNFLVEGQNFFQEHNTVGVVFGMPERESATGWYNVCADSGMAFYPRGFPYKQRHRRRDNISFAARDVPIAVNQGLWMGDPDVDAITWLAYPHAKLRWQRVDSFSVGPKTWLPINSQNTAVSREAMMAYYFIPMNECGMDRMGDIFQGYFLEACVKAVDQGIRVGTPLVDHRRNSHNHMADAYKEIPGIRILEEMLPWLQEVKLDKGSYEAAYLSLAAALEEWVEEKDVYVQSFKSYFHRVAYCMRKWVAACRQL